MSSEIADLLLSRLHGEDVEGRHLALTELDEVLEYIPVEELLRLLDDEDAAVRKLAVQPGDTAYRNRRSKSVG